MCQASANTEGGHAQRTSEGGSFQQVPDTHAQSLPSSYARFEHAIADFGQSQGNVATGFVLADMVDPQRLTSTANAYGYKQLAYEPILGGGLLTALSVPLIAEVRLPAFTIASFLLLLAVGLWGIFRR